MGFPLRIMSETWDQGGRGRGGVGYWVREEKVWVRNSIGPEIPERSRDSEWRWLLSGPHLLAASNEFLRKPSLRSCVGGVAGTGNTFANLIEEDKVVPILTGLHGLQRE